MTCSLRNIVIGLGITSILAYNEPQVLAKEYTLESQTVEFMDKPIQELTDLLVGERTCNFYRANSSFLTCEREGRPKPELYYGDITTQAVP